MNTIRVDLSEGDYAELYVQLRHGTARKLQEIYQPYMPLPAYQEAIEISNLKERAKALEKIISQVDITRASDMMILGQIKEWSFGEISQNVLDDISQSKHEILTREANKLYAPPLTESKLVT